MNDDETIEPGRVAHNSHRQGGDTTAPYLDLGRVSPITSVDSDLTGRIKNYLPGDIVDGTYQLMALIGRGGMGVVFACKHTVLDRDYAIKILPGEALSDEQWQRFQAEAKVLARLDHPNIVGVYNMGVDGGICPYYVMDLLVGETLDQIIEKNKFLPVDQALDCFIQVADALSSAHTQGIIHRDIKPSNLMLLGRSAEKIGKVKLVDFGIARLSKQGLGAQSQTATGLVFGTPYYMSPEQTQGKRVDHRSDIYSFGCALFETLTGALPFAGDNAFHTFMLHQTETPPRLTDRAAGRTFAPALELAIDKMLRKAPAERYQTMAQVKQDLERIKAGKDIMLNRAATDDGALGVGQTESTDYSQFENDKKVNQWPLILSGALLGAALVGTIAWAFLTLSPKHTKKVVDDDYTFIDILDPQRIARYLKEYGCSDAEIAIVRNEDFKAEYHKQEYVTRMFKEFLERLTRQKETVVSSDRTRFNFPHGIIIGAIQFGEEMPIMAVDSIHIPAGKNVYFYQNYCLKTIPLFVQIFGPDDISGLEVEVDHAEKTIEVLKSWKRLKHLSFFNSLTKPLPMFEQYDESILKDSNLDEIDKLTTLQSLGLTGEISAKKVTEMSILSKINSLRLKRVKDIDTILNKVVTLENIRELWLVRENLNDEQLKVLAKMPNLNSLCLRRNKLTPDAIATLSQLPHLQKLSLDCDWPQESRDELKRKLPFAQIEPILDRTYWPVMSVNYKFDWEKERREHHHHHKTEFKD